MWSDGRGCALRKSECAMIWNYRIVKYIDGSGWGLHEVFYNDNGEPSSMTAEPISFVAMPNDEPNMIRDDLRDALEDATNYPILDEPEKWPEDND